MLFTKFNGHGVKSLHSSTKKVVSFQMFQRKDIFPTGPKFNFQLRKEKESNFGEDLNVRLAHSPEYSFSCVRFKTESPGERTRQNQI